MSAPIRWGKVDSKLYQNDKFRKLPASATGLWLLCLTWSADNETDGFIPRDVAASVCRDHREAGRLSRFAAYLVEAGLWDEAEGGFMIHDFSDYWLTKIQKTEIRAADADRQRRHRATGQPALNQHSTSTQPALNQGSTSTEGVLPDESVVSHRDTGRKSKSKRERTQETSSLVLASDLNSSHIVAKWIENYPGKPPERTRGQLSREIKNLLGQGYPWELVNRAVAEWSRSGLAPSQLSSFLDQLQRGVGYGVRRIGSRNDQMFIEAQETRELARQLDAADRGELA